MKLDWRRKRDEGENGSEMTETTTEKEQESAWEATGIIAAQELNSSFALLVLDWA